MKAFAALAVGAGVAMAACNFQVTVFMDNNCGFKLSDKQFSNIVPGQCSSGNNADYPYYVMTCGGSSITLDYYKDQSNCNEKGKADLVESYVLGQCTESPANGGVYVKASSNDLGTCCSAMNEPLPPDEISGSVSNSRSKSRSKSVSGSESSEERLGHKDEEPHHGGDEEPLGHEGEEPQHGGNEEPLGHESEKPDSKEPLGHEGEEPEHHEKPLGHKGEKPKFNPERGLNKLMAMLKQMEESSDSVSDSGSDSVSGKKKSSSEDSSSEKKPKFPFGRMPHIPKMPFGNKRQDKEDAGHLETQRTGKGIKVQRKQGAAAEGLELPKMFQKHDLKSLFSKKLMEKLKAKQEAN